MSLFVHTDLANREIASGHLAAGVVLEYKERLEECFARSTGQTVNIRQAHMRTCLQKRGAGLHLLQQCSENLLRLGIEHQWQGIDG